MKLFVSPHNDDETLFGAFTLLREHPLVVIVYDSFRQERRGFPVTALQRREETEAALKILGCGVKFLGFRDDDPTLCPGVIRRRIEALRPAEVWAPAFEDGGHDQHNEVAKACAGLPNLTRYLTYTKAGKSTGREVPFEPKWPMLKLRALACYESQLVNPRLGCVEHFLREQKEYYAA